MPENQTIRTILRVVAALVVMSVVVALVDVSSIVAHARSADPALLVVALLLMPVNVVLEVLVWRPLIHAVDPAIGFRNQLRAVLTGFAFGIITPGRVGEFYGRTLEVPAENRWAVAASVVAARIAELVVLGCFGLVALLPFSRLFPVNNWVGYLGGAGALWFVALTLAFFVPSKLLGRLAVGPLRRFVKPFRFLGRVDLRRRVEVLFYSALRYVVFAAQFGIAVVAFGIPAEVRPILLTIAVVFLLRALAPPVSFLDLGIREGVAAFVFSEAGFSSAAAFDAALAIFAINVLLPALVGVPFAIRSVESAHAGPARHTT